MDVIWLIRSMIFLIAGIIPILFPKKVNTWQNHVLKRLHIKYKIKYVKKSYYRIGIAFIIISIILLLFSIIGVKSTI